MGAGTRSTDAEPSAETASPDPRRLQLRPLVEGAVALLALAAIFRGIALAIDNPMTGTFVGAVVVSFVLGRAGVPLAGRSRRALRRASVGSLLAGGAIVAAVFAALPFGARLELVAPSTALVFGTAEALAVAFRDEIWLHGMPLAYAARAGVPRWAAGIFAVAASVAAVALEPGATAVGLFGVAAASALFVILWIRSRDGWAPIAAHFAWAWLAGALLAGELFQLSPAQLMHGPTSRGALGTAMALSFAAAAAIAISRQLPEAAPEELS
jgi:hypothetical protein